MIVLWAFNANKYRCGVHYNVRDASLFRNDDSWMTNGSKTSNFGFGSILQINLNLCVADMPVMATLSARAPEGCPPSQNPPKA